jgi:DNA-binding response OmpR family regulator
VSEQKESGGIRADKRSRRAYVRRGKSWKETPALRAREFELLWVLLSHAGAPVERETLLKALWDGDLKEEPSAVDRQVGALRKKLGKEGARIASVYGRGYQLTA